jgi:outer membrane protein TolC
MNKKTKFLGAAISMISVFGLFAFSQERKEISLSLEDSIVRALKNNLNVAVEVIGPKIADSAVSQAKEFFMPRLDFNYGSDRSESPATWGLQRTTGTYTFQSRNYAATLVQQIPTGGNLSISLSSARSESNQLYQVFNPSYRGSLSFEFTQPLLRDFGPQISLREIHIAQNASDASRSQFKSTLMDTVFQVEQAYWNLVYAIENLKVKQQSLQLGRDLLARTKKEIQVGQTAPIEILNAEATVAQREAVIVQAEAAVKRNEDTLKTLINVGTDAPSRTMRVVPSDKPAFKPVPVSLEEAFQKAVGHRPELEVLASDIDTQKINFSFAKNQLLPTLDLKLNKTSPGISGTQILYLNNDPLSGVLIGQIKGSSAKALQDAMKFLYNNWTVGLTLSIPFGDVLGRARYASAKQQLDQAQARLKAREQQIYLDVSDAVLNLETSAKSVEAYRIARELAEKRLEAEMRKLNIGLTTNYFVLQYQEALSEARSMEVRALADYNISVAAISKATGSILEERHITLDDRSHQ